jgi:hypothetical protein
MPVCTREVNRSDQLQVQWGKYTTLCFITCYFVQTELIQLSLIEDGCLLGCCNVLPGKGYRRFRVVFCLQHQGENGVKIDLKGFSLVCW